MMKVDGLAIYSIGFDILCLAFISGIFIQDDNLKLDHILKYFKILKPKDWNFFSVRNHNDKFYCKGKEIEKGIYDINGFQIRFFTENEIICLTASEGFEILQMKEEQKNQLCSIL